MHKSKLAFHEGKALIRLAEKYPTLLAVILESIQNAIDTLASTVWVTVNLHRSTVTVRDDGTGATKDYFEKALLSVCHSIKPDDKMGRWGLGLISPLGKCDMFTFTSTKRGTMGPYLRWTFDTEKLERQSKIDGIPFEEVNDIVFMPSGSTPPFRKQTVPWRTEVAMRGVTKDRLIGKVELSELRDTILERFSEAMRKRGTMIVLTVVSRTKERAQEEIVALQFDGKRLPVVRYEGKDCGGTTFELYLARKKSRGRTGKVSVGIRHNDYRVGIRDFARSATGLLAPEVVDALTSGVFEGYIISQKCELNSDRKGFVQNDALVDFCLHLERWVQEVGLKHLQDLDDMRRDERFQVLGLKSLSIIEDMLKSPGFEHLMKVIKGFRYGTTGTGHFPKGRVVETQEKPSVAIQGSGTKSRKGSSGTTASAPPKTDHPEHSPGSVLGTLGRRRKVVRGHSTGLQFSYDEMPGQSVLWQFDVTYGVLHFNTGHPLWEKAERKSDRVLMRFQEHITVKALTLATIPPEWTEVAEKFVYEELPAVLHLLLNERPTARKKSAVAAAA